MHAAQEQETEIRRLRLEQQRQIRDLFTRAHSSHGGMHTEPSDAAPDSARARRADITGEDRASSPHRVIRIRAPQCVPAKRGSGRC
jgi:hypothetical protein